MSKRGPSKMGPRQIQYWKGKVAARPPKPPKKKNRPQGKKP